MLSPAETSALILAGGRATRLGGIAKHAIVIDGETILARQTKVLAPLVREILLSTSEEVVGYRCVRDVAGAVGPLAGIAAGLAACETPWLLVVAGDMPDIDPPLISQLFAHARADAVGFRVDEWPEPLCCLLRVAPARVQVDDLLAQQRYKASGLLDALDTAWIALQAPVRGLRNINTPADL